MKKDGTYRYAYTYYNPGGIYYLPYENLWDNYHWKGKDMKKQKPKKVLLTPEEQYDLEQKRAQAALKKRGQEALEAIQTVNPKPPDLGTYQGVYRPDYPRLWTEWEIRQIVGRVNPPTPKKRGFWPW